VGGVGHAHATDYSLSNFRNIPLFVTVLDYRNCVKSSWCGVDVTRGLRQPARQTAFRCQLFDTRHLTLEQSANLLQVYLPTYCYVFNVELFCYKYFTYIGARWVLSTRTQVHLVSVSLAGNRSPSVCPLPLPLPLPGRPSPPRSPSRSPTLFHAHR
jgi:hypothetical protein